MICALKKWFSSFLSCWKRPPQLLNLRVLKNVNAFLTWYLFQQFQSNYNLDIFIIWVNLIHTQHVRVLLLVLSFLFLSLLLLDFADLLYDYILIFCCLVVVPYIGSTEQTWLWEKIFLFNLCICALDMWHFKYWKGKVWESLYFVISIYIDVSFNSTVLTSVH